ncbi:MAG: hypothetical protein ABFD59_01590 [Smithella sp.]
MRIINTNIKSMAYIALLLFIFFCFLAATADAAPQVKTDKDVYGPGETIKVNFFNAPGSSRDWICIAAAGAKDDDAGDYKTGGSTGNLKSCRCSSRFRLIYFLQSCHFFLDKPISLI